MQNNSNIALVIRYLFYIDLLLKCQKRDAEDSVPYGDTETRRHGDTEDSVSVCFVCSICEPSFCVVIVAD